MCLVADAASKGDLERVCDLLEGGTVADKGACELAAAHGHADVLALLLDRGVPAGNAVAYAVWPGGSVACLDELYERGYPLTEIALKWGVRRAPPEVSVWLSARVVEPKVWIRAFQSTLDKHAHGMKEDAYLELSRMTKECHQMCTPSHSC